MHLINLLAGHKFMAAKSIGVGESWVDLGPVPGCIRVKPLYLVGGAISPSWKMMEFVNGKDDIPYIVEKKKCSKPPTRYHDEWQNWQNQGWRFKTTGHIASKHSLPIFAWFDCICLFIKHVSSYLQTGLLHMGCSLGLRLSIPLHTCYIILLSFDTLVASPNQSQHKTQSFPDGLHGKHHVSRSEFPKWWDKFRLVDAFPHSVGAKRVPLFHDATEINPLDFLRTYPIQVAPACIARLKSLMAASCSFCKLRHRELAQAVHGRSIRYSTCGNDMEWCLLTDLASFLRKKHIFWEKIGRTDWTLGKSNTSFQITDPTQPTYSYVRIRMMIGRCVKGIKQTWIQTRQDFSVQASTSTRTCQVG